MAVMLTLGRLRQNGESEASRGCIGLSQKKKKKHNRYTNKQENTCLACRTGTPGETWKVKQKWQEATGGPKSEAGSEMPLDCPHSEQLQHGGGGGTWKAGPESRRERVGRRSRERKAKWWRRAVRSTASESSCLRADGQLKGS